MKNQSPLKFETEEQEAEYWDTHSPLEGSVEPDVEQVRVKTLKDRPISIRLDSESRRKLEQLAKKRGLGPSTFARHLLMAAIQGEERQLESAAFEAIVGRLGDDLPQSIKDQAESLLKAIAIGDPKNPSLLLVDRSQMKAWDELGGLLVKALLTVARVKQNPVPQHDNAGSSTPAPKL